MTIGQRINKIRKEKGLSLAELADKADISRGTLHYWLYHDDVCPQIMLLIAVADVLDVSLDELVGRAR